MIPKKIARKSKPAGYDFRAEGDEGTECKGHQKQGKKSEKRSNF